MVTVIMAIKYITDYFGARLAPARDTQYPRTRFHASRVFNFFSFKTCYSRSLNDEAVRTFKMGSG